MAYALRAERLISDRGTQHTQSHFAMERMLDQIGNAKSHRVAGFELDTVSYTVTPPTDVHVWTISMQSGDGESQPNQENLSQLIAAFQSWSVFRADPPNATTRASSQVTATNFVDIRDVLRKRQSDQRLSRMSPARRALYDDIIKLRNEIGPIDVDVSQIAREIREE